ncbi:MAG: AmmeMemoRadiSam system radical SAM enzyme [Nitrospinae bacterium]|nr:AmmeMemoRadiSam system radical SAM enzyme [Nitrospinota bacterium]
MKESPYYKQHSDGKVECTLCEFRCILKNNQKGICSVRQNIDGKLFSLNYGKVVALSPDPVEKKPLFHFQPGSFSFSIACQGCNFSCQNCQNWQTSQQFNESTDEIKDFNLILQLAEKYRCSSLSYTYSEPTIYAETALETAKIGAKAGLKNIFVTNGYESSELLNEMEGLIHGANIDLKSFSKKFYKKVCGGVDVNKVLKNIELFIEKNIWVEITTLVIPGKNDSTEELRDIASFIAGLGKHIPWHVSAFHPTYKMLDSNNTPLKTLINAREIGLKEGLKYVYQGNIPGGGGENTFCSHCNELLIERLHFQIISNRLIENKCPHCKTSLEGVF